MTPPNRKPRDDPGERLLRALEAIARDLHRLAEQSSRPPPRLPLEPNPLIELARDLVRNLGRR